MTTSTTDRPVSGKKPLLFILSGSGVLLVGLALYLLAGFPGFGLIPAGTSLALLLQVYWPWLVAAGIALAGLVILLIGVVAAGVRLALGSSRRLP